MEPLLKNPRIDRGIAHGTGMGASAVMRGGKLAEMAAAEQILGEPREEYTKVWLAAVPAL